MELNERLQMARAQANFPNATEAARFFGWNENTYRSHENGTRGFKRVDADKYATTFKVQVEWLLYERGQMKEDSRDETKIEQLRGLLRDLKEEFEPGGTVELQMQALLASLKENKR